MNKIDEDNIVEVPLDPKYITEDGMYMAGYIWGRHIRNPKSAPKDAPEVFIRGVEDGYGDGLTAWGSPREWKDDIK